MVSELGPLRIEGDTWPIAKMVTHGRWSKFDTGSKAVKRGKVRKSLSVLIPRGVTSFRQCVGRRKGEEPLTPFLHKCRTNDAAYLVACRFNFISKTGAMIRGGILRHGLIYLFFAPFGSYTTPRVNPSPNSFAVD